jgi:catechol 2,3-dioxygenase-like lactoylglutathione lyase family enzyme
MCTARSGWVTGEQAPQEQPLKKRTAEPSLTSAEYGRSLPPFTVNLLVTDVARSLGFYRAVLGAEVIYWDEDFAAIKLGDVDMMLHADHAYDSHPWHPGLTSGERRGLGAELRLLGLDPEAVAERAAAAGAAVVRPVTQRGHGWREVAVQDPDGYLWAVGVLTAPDA